jgi:predicted nuclease of predicted toxin-antitoxin system
MWLLDKNVPIQLVDLLRDLGVEAQTAEAKGWGGLTNGELVAATAQAGISCILTRDHLFAQSAAKALKVHTSLSIVVLTLAQLRAPAFLEAFQQAWSLAPIGAIAGEVIRWPDSAFRFELPRE